MKRRMIGILAAMLLCLGLMPAAKAVEMPDLSATRVEFIFYDEWGTELKRCFLRDCQAEDYTAAGPFAPDGSTPSGWNIDSYLSITPNASLYPEGYTPIEAPGNAPLLLGLSGDRISGAEDGYFYCSNQNAPEFTIDNVYPDFVSFYVKDEDDDLTEVYTVQEGADNIYLTPNDPDTGLGAYYYLDCGDITGDFSIVAEDAQGHETWQRDMHLQHSYTWYTNDEEHTYWQKCGKCGHITPKATIPESEIFMKSQFCRMETISESMYVSGDVTIRYCLRDADGNVIQEETSDGEAQDGGRIELHEVSFAPPASGWTPSEFRLEITMILPDGYETPATSLQIEVVPKHVPVPGTCEGEEYCDICREIIGDIDPDAHINPILHEAKEPTMQEPGNIEYFYCFHCNRYFTYDENGKIRYLTLSETILPKLEPSPSPSAEPTPSPTPTPTPAKTVTPATGDGGHLAVWMAMLALAAGGVTAMALATKRKKQH